MKLQVLEDELQGVVDLVVRLRLWCEGVSEDDTNQCTHCPDDDWIARGDGTDGNGHKVIDGNGNEK